MNKYTKRFLSAVSLAAFLASAFLLLDYLLVPMSRADFFLHDMKRMKSEGTNIDMIILGNSHFLYGLNPLFFEEDLGLENVYNASVTGGQTSSDYYILESMLNDFEPKIVVFDAEWQSLYEYGTEITQSKLLGLDRLKGTAKIRHIFNDFLPSEWIYALLPPYRFRDKIYNFEAVKGNVRLKRWARDTGYRIDYYQTSKGYDKGMTCVSAPYPMRSVGEFDRSRITERSKNYLDGIVDLCKKKGIELFLVTAPVTASYQMNVENYQDDLDYYNAYAREKGVHFFDINMLKQKDALFPDDSFYDDGHLCETGAENASRICAGLIRDVLNGIDISDSFYDSYDAFAADLSRIASVGADVEAGEEAIRVADLRFTAGNGAEVLFEVQLSENGEDFIPVRGGLVPGSSFDIPLTGIDPGTVQVKIIGRDASSGSESYAVYSINLD